MDFMIPILMAVVLIIVIVFVMFITIGRSKGSSSSKSSGSREKTLKEAEKKLSQDPRNPDALKSAGDIYFRGEAWDQTYKIYSTLMELDLHGPDEFEVSFRYAFSAMKLGLSDDAYKGFNIARSHRQNNFEVNYNLGVLEFQKNNYEKAITLLNTARTQEPDDTATLRTLGHSYFRLKKHKEAMTLIRKAIDLAPDDKESLYTLAECYYEANQTEQAQRIFSHLRGDPVMGPSACLTSGMISFNARQYEKAVNDFEIGLRHQNIKPDVKMELRYRLASSYLKLNDMGKAIAHLKEIYVENPNYKDVGPLLNRYQELNANKNLQIFLMAPSGDFVALCRKIVMSYFPRAKIKITSITVNKNEWADILTEVDTQKWSDLIMFRFIRTQGAIGELVVRDFHSHLKEVKAGKGICLTVGIFSEGAKRYTEARLIDLIEKDKLQVILNSVDTKIAATPEKK